MSSSNLKSKDLKVGDLVTHILYGEEWIGMIVSFKRDKKSHRALTSERALVQIQPSTKYDGFFSRVSEEERVNDNLGYVLIHWLFKVKERDEGSRSSRSKAQPCRRGGKKIS